MQSIVSIVREQGPSWQGYSPGLCLVEEHASSARAPRSCAAPDPLSKGTVMSVYMVERSLKGIAMGELAAAQQAAITTSKQFTADGTTVRYIRSTFVPESGACMCLFEASGADAVKRVNEAAKIPFDRIIEALDLTP